MNINQYIKELLYKVDVVPVERLGTFKTYETPSRINQEANTIEPPRKAIRFTDEIEGEVNHLLTYIQQKENITFDQAKYKINDFVEAIKAEVKHNFGYTIDGVGTFIEGNQDDVRFIPDPQANFNLATYGLTATPLPKKSQHTEPIEFKPESVVSPHETILEPYTESAVSQNGVRNINEVKSVNVAEAEPPKVTPPPVQLPPKAEPVASFQEKPEPDYNEPVKGKKTVTEVLEEKLGVKDLKPELPAPAPETKKSLGILGWLVPLFLLGALIIMVFQIKKSNNANPVDIASETTATTNEVVDNENANNKTGTSVIGTDIESSDEAEVVEYVDNTTTTEETETTASTTNTTEEVNNNDQVTETTDYSSETVKTETPKYDLPSSNESVTFTSASDVPSGYYAITGVFNEKSNAEKNCRKLIRQGYDAKAVQKNGAYRISVYLADNESTGKEMLQRVRNEVKSDAWLIKY